ncbi:MAG TPA: hypothetical protein VLI04_00765 [Nocardioidaceae bacterium]|nr:hypothetical protein [Nocardioidaceae bacterium]
MTAGPLYCTILARNYLAKALALGDSVHRHHPGSRLVVLLIDALDDDQLPDAPEVAGVTLVSTKALGIPDRDVLALAAGYDLVEFATSVKPLLLRELLRESEQVVYLDPDTYVVAPMVELPPALASSDGGILLTPHFQEPVPAGEFLSEGHLLTVGVHNLGFCAVDRRAGEFLDWWWSHLEGECLHEPLSGLFVDQKWVDLGSTLFRAATFRHYGYNVGVGNLFERPIAKDVDGYVVASNGDRLRLYHFHAFDASRPDELTTRANESTAHLLEENPALDELCKEYADMVLDFEAALGELAGYPYWTDTTGRRIARQMRRVHRQQRAAGLQPPSPFVPAEAEAYEAWRKSSRKQVLRGLVGDAAKSVRVTLPDEYERLKTRFPGVASKFTGRFVDRGGMWG